MDQLLVALDVDTEVRALQLAADLRGTAGGFKIGSRLFTAEGPSVVETLVGRGDRVFLDLKFHDIPSTVAAAVQAASDLGVWMLTVHASGGKEMLKAAREVARGTPQGPMIVAVTVLTSLDTNALGDVGIKHSVTNQVNALAQLVKAAGLDGVVASAWETAQIRKSCGRQFTIVTPGIRSASEPTKAVGSSAERDDQIRTLSASQAIQLGANYVVVGRPIIAAKDPRSAAEKICRELMRQPTEP